jgi:hypothetical protein
MSGIMENHGSMIISSLQDFPTIIEAVSNYDVLLTISSSEPPWTMADFALDPTRNHIGNNRFRIMCQMHAGKEDMLDTMYDMIAQHICLDIVDGPRRGGTFLCRDGDQLRELPKDCALAFIKLQLVSNPPIGKLYKGDGGGAEGEPNNNEEEEGMKRRRRSSLLRRSLSSGNMLEDQKKRFAFRRSLLLSDVSSDEEEEEKEEEADRTKEDELPKPSFQCNTSSGGSSITRRPTFERSPSWSEGMDELVTVVHTANALDVIFKKSVAAARDQYQLVPSHHTGNNRLLVMVQLRLPKFLLLNLESDRIENTKSLCMELVTAVKDNYNGRFLVEPEEDKDYFILLTDDRAAKAIHCLFQFEAELESSECGTTASIGNYPTTTLEPNSLAAADEISSQGSLIQNKNRTPSLIKREAMQQLHQLSTSLNDFISSNPDNEIEPGHKTSEGDIHKFALESLQKRKKRQGLTSKISRMVAYNPSAAPFTSRVERRQSASELPRRSITGGLTRLASTGHSIEQDLRNSAPVGLSFAESMRELASLPTGSNVPSTIPEWDESLLEPTDFGLSDIPIREQMSLSENNNAFLEQHPFYQLQEPSQRRPSALSRFSQVMIQDMLLKFNSGDDDWNLPSLEQPPEATEETTAVAPSVSSTNRWGVGQFERTEI